MRYTRLKARDGVAVPAGLFFENFLSDQERAKGRRKIREKVERLIWLIVSVTMIWFGDGTNNLAIWLYRRYSAVRWFDSVKRLTISRHQVFLRSWFLLALFALSANITIVIYLIHRHHLHRKGSKWESQASWAVPASCFLGIVSCTGCVKSVWPVNGHFQLCLLPDLELYYGLYMVGLPLSPR